MDLATGYIQDRKVSRTKHHIHSFRPNRGKGSLISIELGIELCGRAKKEA